jgi:hypothetical protein
MRKIALVLSIIILVMTGCQMTPQEKVVMSKRDEAFEKMVLVEAENNDYDFPEHYKDSFKGKDRSIDIKIDANVIVPDVSTFPVVKVKPIPISEEKVRLGADVLFEGRGGYYPSFIRTKSQIEDRILRLKAQIADEDALLESYDGNEEWAKMSIANNKKIIKDLKEEIKSAPEEVGHNPTNFTFQTHEFYTKEGQEKKKAVVSLNTPTPCPSPDATMDDRQSMYLIAEDVLSDEMFSRFRVSNEYGFSEINLRGEQRYELHFYKCYSHMGTRNLFDYDLFHSNFGDGDIGAGFKELKLTQNEARALAENTLDDMNILGYYLESFK